MQRIALSAGVLVLMASATPAVGGNRASAEVQSADQQYNRALERSDTAALRDLIADTYVFTDPTGRVSGRGDVIGGIASKRIRIQSQSTRDVRIEIFGDAAIETGLLTSVAVRDGRNSGGTFRFTRVWVKQAGRWRTAAMQETASRDQLPPAH
jgi:ketosteroid isomerase-like protein